MYFHHELTEIENFPQGKISCLYKPQFFVSLIILIICVVDRDENH